MPAPYSQDLRERAIKAIVLLAFDGDHNLIKMPLVSGLGAAATNLSLAPTDADKSYYES